MTTQPGDGKGKPKKTVAAASAKPARDETKVDLKPVDETTPDLTAIKDDSPADTEDKAIAPVKDPVKDPVKGTAETPKPKTEASTKPAAAKDTKVDIKADATAKPAKADTKTDTRKPDWTKPAEPASSVSGSRVDKPLGSGAAPAASATRSSGGFAGTVLKDRPATDKKDTKDDATKKPATGKPARRAQLQLARLEPWSVMKFSFVMSLVCFVVLLVAVIVLWLILSGLGVFSAISDTVNELTRQQGQTGGGLDAGSWFSFARVFGYTVLVGALNVLLITALSTVGSVIYNLAADLVGGVEVTLKEAE
ncbi:hypothetical protein GCM10009678_05610 [Actinomadura kijaniata]|uniref:DUF3566 domain-containing protein n=1 Tax=Actinomadura namibiensis TaxID=182080 RepID=A0A7W3QKF3_ACTNM|nr:DUF3566 domain-containing protein [Actinomadura namibiensis]MBA8950474.1 hypothetical protein [Actinomadura namibiensis]